MTPAPRNFSGPADFRGISPAGLLLAATLAGWMLVALQPRLLPLLGILDYGLWFLDTQAVLAANDALRAGLDPIQPNPLDYLGRPHSYSDWWFVLRWIGLGREQNFWVGLAWAGLFLGAAIQALRPRNHFQALVGLALLLSPVTLLAVYRGNNDIVIFALLALAGGLLTGPQPSRWVGAGALIGLATGLKFYPAAAAAVFLLRPYPDGRILTTVLFVAVAAVLGSVWPSIGRGFFAIPPDVHKVGAGILLADLGLSSPAWRLAAGGVILGAGWAWARRGWLDWPAPAGDTRLPERAWFTMAAAVLVGSFLVGVGYAYRWIFLLLLPAAMFGLTPAPGRAQTGHRLLWVLILGLAWLDGLFCLALNLRPGAHSQTDLDATMRVWRLVTQPLHWLFITLLAGWLWQLLSGSIFLRTTREETLRS